MLNKEVRHALCRWCSKLGFDVTEQEQEYNYHSFNAMNDEYLIKFCNLNYNGGFRQFLIDRGFLITHN